MSVFRTHHSTETALNEILSDLGINSDKNKGSVLILIDLSAAFEVPYHDILINHLGLSECV